MTTKNESVSVKPYCLRMAIEFFGTKAELARAMKTSAQNVENWSRKNQIPTSQALQIERATGGKIKARDVLIEHEWIVREVSIGQLDMDDLVYLVPKIQTVKGYTEGLIDEMPPSDWFPTEKTNEDK